MRFSGSFWGTAMNLGPFPSTEPRQWPRPKQAPFPLCPSSSTYTPEVMDLPHLWPQLAQLWWSLQAAPSPGPAEYTQRLLQVQQDGLPRWHPGLYTTPSSAQFGRGCRWPLPPRTATSEPRVAGAATQEDMRVGGGFGATTAQAHPQPASFPFFSNRCRSSPDPAPCRHASRHAELHLRPHWAVFLFLSSAPEATGKHLLKK